MSVNGGPVGVLIFSYEGDLHASVINAVTWQAGWLPLGGATDIGASARGPKVFGFVTAKAMTVGFVFIGHFAHRAECP